MTSKVSKHKKLILGSALAGFVISGPALSVTATPGSASKFFQTAQLEVGYRVANAAEEKKPEPVPTVHPSTTGAAKATDTKAPTDTKAKDGHCSAEKKAEGKCAGGKCSSDAKAKDGHCSAEKKTEGKCAGGKCSAEKKTDAKKAGDGKCGAGSCG